MTDDVLLGLRVCRLFTEDDQAFYFGMSDMSKHLMHVSYYGHLKGMRFKSVSKCW